jgi:type IV pilus assembly protein PilV
MISIAPRSSRAGRGFTLIEILVTLVLISVGLLGVAALQLRTLRANKESYVRSQAGVLAADILDRMRANPSAFRNGEYDVTWNGTSAPAPATGSGSSSTSPSGPRAVADLTAWQTAINNTLPGDADTVAGRIVRANNVVTVTIRWSERSEGTGETNDVGGSREFQTRTEI